MLKKIYTLLLTLIWSTSSAQPEFLDLDPTDFKPAPSTRLLLSLLNKGPEEQAVQDRGGRTWYFSLAPLAAGTASTFTERHAMHTRVLKGLQTDPSKLSWRITFSAILGAGTSQGYTFHMQNGRETIGSFTFLTRPGYPSVASENSTRPIPSLAVPTNAHLEEDTQTTDAETGEERSYPERLTSLLFGSRPPY